MLPLFLGIFLMAQSPPAPPPVSPSPVPPTVPSAPSADAATPAPEETAPADRVKTITLPEILAHAITHSRSLMEAGLKIASSRATLHATSAMFDTQLSANLNAVSQESEFVPGNVFSLTGLKKYSFDAQIARLLPTGGLVALQFSSSRTDQTMTLAMAGPPQKIESKAFANAFTFVFSHPLLAGFGRDVTEAPARKARIQLDADRLAREAKAQALVRDLVIAYWNLWVYWQEQELLEVSLKVAKSQLELTRALFSVNRVTDSDLLAVRNAVAQREGDLVMAKLRILQASLAIKNQLNLPLDEELLRPAEKELQYVPKTLPPALVSVVVKRSKDLAVLEKNLELLRQEERVARNSLLPKLNVTLTAGPTGNAKDYTSAWESLVKFSGFTITGGLSFSWTVEQTQARATLEILDAAAQNLRLQKENLSNGLVMAALMARQMMQAAQRRIELARVAVESAQSHLDVEMKLFALGRGTNHSVLLRMAELDAAKLSMIKAVYDYWTAWVQIQALSGDILEEYQLKLQD